jgi:hypothetical protein
MLDRAGFDRMKQLLLSTDYASEFILVGSAALYLCPTKLPPLTADADFLVPCEALAGHVADFLAGILAVGFERVADTATFSHREGFSFDLLGLEPPGQGDHITSLGTLSLLVFDDLSRLAQQPAATGQVDGLKVLSPAGLAVSKLLTWRLEKGSKDKLQALALIGELQADLLFRKQLQHLVGSLSGESWEDAVADAQVAFMELSEAHGYAGFADLVVAGFEILQGLRS